MRFLFLFFWFYSNLIFSQDYYVYVAAESDDEVSLIKFDGKKAIELKKFSVGVWPAENEGHHADIGFGWGYAKIKIYTHAIKGLHESDFVLAAKVDKIS